MGDTQIFLSRCEPVKPDTLCDSKIEWWDRCRTDILIPKERTRREGKGGESQVSLKPARQIPLALKF